MSDLQTRFKATMAHYPAGVVIVTTRDAQGAPQGFTATSFSSLSMDPPSVLVCLANSAFCYDAFVNARHFAINFVGAGHDDLAMRFARRGEDKFGGLPMLTSDSGVPVLRDAAAYIECESNQHLVSGDHAILIGNVANAHVDPAHDVLVYCQRRFGSVHYHAA